MQAETEKEERRRASVPALVYPPALPVSERRADLLAAIADHQVVIVAGETGSGKSTQLPKLCLEAGRGIAGMIGHTQPRRVAARAIAERVAEEIGTDLGDLVGYAVRFTDRVSDRTLVKVMTDGILLAEIQRDRLLRRYDTIVVDEAHERSLNIDFILGYLRQLLPRRPDLMVVITSATLDTQRFSDHFGGAPVVEVSGRTYPVEVRYRPAVDDDGVETDPAQAIADAVRELAGEGPGDVLVFLSGEREIRDTADTLTKLDLPDTEVLPLYARLPAAEQHRVFEPHKGRRIVLATNVAETSLTVPGVRYVVDPGTARISRYSRRTKVQRLPIEAVSQASANQRAGRCGRVAPGICIRLYAKDDFDGRPEFTEPEILRTNLASVILQMAAIGLGDIAAFPFVEPPDARNVKDGIALLEELGALKPPGKDGRARLTPMGRQLAQLPLDPRLGRMVVEAEQRGCLREVKIIAAALAIQDPRERPAEKRGEADAMHARFAAPGSDFLAFVNLWEHVRTQQKALSSGQFRRMCRREFLNYLRVREWQDVHSQLGEVTRGLGLRANSTPADPDQVHQALLSGLLSLIGTRDGERKEYRGARDSRFALSPGSSLFGSSPRWVMAAELVETTRVWAHVAGRIEPEWAEALGDHLVKRSYSEPRWERKRASATATERVTLYGLPLVVDRRVEFGRIDPEWARELFIRHALVDGDWDAHHAFLAENERLIAAVQGLEDRVRRRDILVTDDEIYDLYAARIPDTVTNGRAFDRWWKTTKASHPEQLTFTFEELVDTGGGRIRLDDYPDHWRQGDLTLPLSYVFDPGAPNDGVTVHIPLEVLNQVVGTGFDWHIPGRRRDLVTALLRTLPKPLRRHVVPLADYVEPFVTTRTPSDGPLLDRLAGFLSRRVGVAFRPGDFDVAQLPGDLRLTFRVEDGEGRTLAEGKDLRAVGRHLRGESEGAVARAAATYEQPAASDWRFGAIPRVVTVDQGARRLKAFPALTVEDDGVSVRVYADEPAQSAAMWAGTCHLLRLRVPSPRKNLDRVLGNSVKLLLSAGPQPAAAVLDDCIDAAIDGLVAEHGGPAWDEPGFEELRQFVDRNLLDRLIDAVPVVGEILRLAAELRATVAALDSPARADALGDARAQIDLLVFDGFVSGWGLARMVDVRRYLQALHHRLAKLPAQPAKDAELLQRIRRLEARFDDVADAHRFDGMPAGAAGVHWLLQELRVSLFAQHLGTAGKVSEKRVLAELAQLAAAR